jgi:transcriptional regulator with XRE-family HTH domain
MEDYVERLRQIKEEKKLTIAEIAAKLDMPEQYVALIVLGEMVPRPADLDKISEYVLEHI